MSRMAIVFIVSLFCSSLGCDLKKTCTPLEVTEILAEYQKAKTELAAIDTLNVAAARPVIDRLLNATERLDACIPRN